MHRIEYDVESIGEYRKYHNPDDLSVRVAVLDGRIHDLRHQFAVINDLEDGQTDKDGSRVRLRIEEGFGWEWGSHYPNGSYEGRARCR